MVHVRKKLDEIVADWKAGAIRAYSQGKPKNLTPLQRSNWLQRILND